MHEASIAQGILDTAVAAVKEDAARILKIVIVAGALAGIEKESVSLYFDELAKGTLAEGAELELKVEPARLLCTKCGASQDFDSSGPVTVRCSRCGGLNRLQADSSCYVESIEVESENEPEEKQQPENRDR